MAATFGFFHDAVLTQPVSGGDPIARRLAADGSLTAADAVVYLGSPAAGKQARAASNPGVDSIVVGISDTNPGGGAPATGIKLATTSGGLDSAVGGAALDLGVTQLLSGIANAVAVHLRVSSIAAPGTHTDLSITSNTLVEDAV